MFKDTFQPDPLSPTPENKPFFESSRLSNIPPFLSVTSSNIPSLLSSRSSKSPFCCSLVISGRRLMTKTTAEPHHLLVVFAILAGCVNASRALVVGMWHRPGSHSKLLYLSHRPTSVPPQPPPPSLLKDRFRLRELSSKNVLLNLILIRWVVTGWNSGNKELILSSV